MLVVGGVGVLTAVLVAALVVASVVRDAHRAGGIADRAALAAAVPLTLGAGPDCAAAARLATTDGARVTRCSAWSDGSVVVEVSVALGAAAVRWPGVPVQVTARARAGTE
ncbi:hypothetical protein JQN72_10105 [Phycicoccus sp. CSK15P-2]|nr:hypothetical protein [Phycicoccus sp. CSK15P-2]